MDEMNIFNSLGLFDGEKQMKESNKRRVDEKVKNMIRIVGLKISMVHLIPHRLSTRLIISPHYHDSNTKKSSKCAAAAAAKDTEDVASRSEEAK